MRQLIWTVPARDDLRRIDDFLSERRPAAAVATLRAILQKSRMLEQFPSAGPVFRDGHRTLKVVGTPYTLLYRITGDVLVILRVHHEREDWR